MNPSLLISQNKEERCILVSCDRRTTNQRHEGGGAMEGWSDDEGGMKMMTMEKSDDVYVQRREMHFYFLIFIYLFIL